MSISGLSGADSTTLQELRKEIQQDLANLKSSLQSNNLSGAQSAFSALQQLLPSNSTTGSGTSQTDSAASSFQKDIDAIGKALSSGDLAGAQQAFSNLQNLISSQQSGQTSASADSTSSSSSGASNTDPITADFNSLNKALQSGDLSGAQAAFKQLQTDLSSADASQSTGQTQYHHHHSHGTSDSTSSTTGSSGTVSVLG